MAANTDIGPFITYVHDGWVGGELGLGLDKSLRSLCVSMCDGWVGGHGVQSWPANGYVAHLHLAVSRNAMLNCQQK